MSSVCNVLNKYPLHDTYRRVNSKVRICKIQLDITNLQITTMVQFSCITKFGLLHGLGYMSLSCVEFFGANRL